MTNNKTVGAAIRELRKRSGKTVNDSAQRCGHTRSWLSDIESGRRALDFNDAKDLCTFYGFTLQDLSEACDRHAQEYK